ncbi:MULTISPECIES: Trm112 family protein [unclassified Streptomyces]|uniref:Trm112 family protein n=1 Tax=Streptomycetaceae TaxID=2062 RepID=UPI002E79E4BA|nr:MULTISPECIES: Trm112 family protein [unclassified Streptomyces]MED7952396.1 Trm112 family protein [Streptomyces sp. BE303]MEE1826570.1 Trm112 family protein [Streptomyces sp. BE20]
MKLEAFLLEILVCPQCRSALTEGGTEEQPELVCAGEGCGLAYPVRDGIPVLLVDEARRPA